MKLRPSTDVPHGLADLIARVHQIVTGSEISLEQAGRYFHDPAEFTRTIRASGALRDPMKAVQLQELLPSAQRQARNGI